MLRGVGETIQELYGKDGIHIGKLSAIHKILSFKTSILSIYLGKCET
jgi:hypothetical protein